MTATTVISAEEAVGRIRTGDTVMVGGFGLVGAPLRLIDALVEASDATDLTIVSNNIGEPGRGLGKLLR
jgi:acyl CoA:acetate/3-ketoacid CoA transferase alpha subunit